MVGPSAAGFFLSSGLGRRRAAPARSARRRSIRTFHGLDAQILSSEKCSAIQITTAASLCAVVDLHATGKLPKQGFVRQEEVSLPDFLANRFGRCYDCSMKDLSLENGIAV